MTDEGSDIPISEDNSEKPRCPFCGSTESCDHQLALIDFQFGEVEAGLLWDNPTVENWTNQITQAFYSAHKAGKKPAFSSCRQLMRLWRDSRIVDDPDEPVELFYPALYRFLADLLREAGAVGTDRELDQGPCWTTVVCDLYAQDAQQVIDKCTQLLQQRLYGKQRLN